MLQHNEQLYLPTQRMYTLPDDRVYQQVKAAHLLTLDPAYASKSTSEKWTLLIASMTEHFSADQMPMITEEVNHVQTTLQMTPALCTKRFNTFKTVREITSVSYYNLTLEQCVRYFEDLSFLFNTAHPQYQLRNAEKKSLIQSILEAMGECETGINGRFYSILQEFQKDSDWISSELSKARCETLRQLSGSYTAQRGVGDALKIHVYDHFVKFAHEENLGIAQKEHIWDIFAMLLNAGDMKSFFKQHYNKYFQTYEQQADTTLTTHILSEITSVIQIDNNVWQQGPVQISLLDSNALGQVFTNLFPGAPGDLLHQFVDISHDGTMMLMSKADCMVEFRKLIRDKLVATGNYVDVAHAAGNQIYTPKLQAGITIDRLHAFQRALVTHDVGAVSKQEGELLLRTYPELLIHRIKQDPNCICTVKKWVKSTLLVDQILTQLDIQLCAAIEAKNSHAIEDLTRALITLIDPELDYVAQLSAKVLANPEFAAQLLSQNGLAFGYLAPELQSDVNLRDLAQLQNALASQYWQNNSTGLASIQLMKSTLKSQSFDQLAQSEHINTATFLGLVRYLEPLELKVAIAYRKRHGLSALPFCHAADMEKCLDGFSNAIQKLGNEWELQGYLAIKKKACARQIESPSEGDEIDYLAKTNDWFTGFMQFQNNRASSEMLRQRLSVFLGYLFKALSTLLLISVIWYAAFLIIPPIMEFIKPLFWEALGACIGLFMLNGVLRNRWLATFNVVLILFLFLDWALCEILLNVTWNLIKSVFTNTGLFFGVFPFALESLNRFIATQMQSTVVPNVPFTDQCDEIIGRLDLREEASALQKSTILQYIKNRMGAEREPDNAALLHKKYPVVHQGRTYDVSFSDVAKQRRLKTDSFDLEPVSKTWCGLFTLRTGSERLLPNVEEVALPGMGGV